ncbi:MAG: hypothetical protein OXI33_00010 [Chloroflexota bacterium]|nr:hypothetical protein [Chloroflexota bacterium]
MTDSDRIAYVDSIVDDRPELRRKAEEVAALMPDTKPVLAELFVDDEHRLWVQRVTPEGAPAFYDLFSVHGDHLGSVRLAFAAAGPLDPSGSSSRTWTAGNADHGVASGRSATFDLACGNHAGSIHSVVLALQHVK